VEESGAGRSPSVRGVDRRGTVRIREEVRAELPWHRFEGSWQPDADADPETFYSEDGPGWNDVEEAIRWGRRRAPIVYVRLGPGWTEWFNAGEEDDGGRDPTPRWPGSRRRRAANRHPDYGGVVYLGENFPSFMPARRFTATWEPEPDRRAVDQAEFEDVEAAIEWGRERSPVVLVAELPNSWSWVPVYEIRSAGEEDPPGEPLERLRPRAGDDSLEWEVSTQRGASELEPGEFAVRLEAALNADPAVTRERCVPAEARPRLSVLPSVRGGAAADLPEPPLRGWVDVTFGLRAPTRKRAYDVARRIFARAVRETGESWYGYSTNLEVRARL
jgi:hypothetical protein